jgi:hypothetical protein
MGVREVPYPAPHARDHWKQVGGVTRQLRFDAKEFERTTASAAQALEASIATHLVNGTRESLNVAAVWAGLLMAVHLAGSFAKRLVIDLRRWRRRRQLV